MVSLVKVTLVMPVHGDAPFLDETLISISKIDYFDHDTHIILDRSSLKVKAKVEKFKTEQENVVIHESNRPGIVAALNLGIEKSKAQFIARIDSDDLICSNRLALQVKYLESNPDVSIVGTQLLLINELGEPIGKSHYPETDSDLRKLLKYQNCIAHPSVMFRKSHFLESGKYREHFNGAEDYDLWMRMSRLGKLHTINQPLTHYRKSINQHSKNIQFNQRVIENSVRLAAYGVNPFPVTETSKYGLEEMKNLNIKAFSTLKSKDKRVAQEYKCIQIIDKLYRVRSVESGIKRFLSALPVLLQAATVDLTTLINFIQLKRKFSND